MNLTEISDTYYSEQYPDWHTYKCECGYMWDEYPEDIGPLKCKKCGKIQEIELYKDDEYKDIKNIGLGKNELGWCYFCDDLTPNIIKGDNIFCKECDVGIAKNGHFDCPNCGYDGSAIIECGEMVYSMHIALEYGGEPYHWTEYRKCLLCGFEFSIENSNY